MSIEIVKQLVEEFNHSSATSMKIEMNDIKLELEKTPVQTLVTAPAVTNVVEEVHIDQKEEIEGTPVKSPLVGVFYSSSAPDKDDFVKVGDKVTEGQTLCIVEAMKVMNEIKAPKSGKISQILVGKEDLVEFDQTLMLIEG